MAEVRTTTVRPDGVELSVRETEVLRLAAQGLTNAAIGQHLGITTYGVKFHLTSIFRKLGVSNRTEAAVLHTMRTSRG